MPKTDDNRVFVDTNVLLAATDRDRSQHQNALTFLDEGLRGSLRLFVTGQIFREYLVVATRPQEVNGLGLSPQEALKNVRGFKSVLQILSEDDKTASGLMTMIQKHGLKGKRIHDANLIASMDRHGLRQLKTYNPSDFKTFPDVDLLN